MSFKREERLKGRTRIREVFSKGKRYYWQVKVSEKEQTLNQGARLFVLQNNLPYNRICFSFTKAASRNFGDAAARNRARRLGREAFRLIKGRLCAGHDFILLILPESKMTLSGRMEQMETLFKKAGLLK